MSEGTFYNVYGTEHLAVNTQCRNNFVWSHRDGNVALQLGPYEPQRDRKYLLTRVLCDDSNHPVHLRNLISPLSTRRSFASLAIQNASSEGTDQTVRMHKHADLNLR